MKHPRLLLPALRVVLLGVVLQAGSAFAQQAKILKIVGNASAVTVTGAAGAVAPGMTLPVSARIVTGTGVEVFVEAVTGVVAVIKPNADVTVASLGSEENRTLDLRQGSVVSLVDPKRYKANTYGVKTPRGVAAARGTVYVTTVNGDESTTYETKEN
jgi:hypothetical protein